MLWLGIRELGMAWVGECDRSPVAWRYGTSLPTARLYVYIGLNVTYQHKTSLMSRFLHVEFNTPLCRVQSVLQIGENQKYYFAVQRYEVLKTVKTSNLKAHNNEKMALKKKNII